MRKRIFGLLTAGAVFSFTACDSQRASTTPEISATTSETVVTTPAAPAEATTLPDAGDISAEVAATGTFASEAEFAAKAIESGMAEVKFGNLADRKAVDPEVKKFGVQMVQDHTRANAILMRLTKTRKWITPEDMDAENQQVYSQLATIRSDQFDQGYLTQMVKDHEMAVAMFQNAATNVTDPELKSFITNTLPALKTHLGMARDLQKKVEASR